MTLKIHHLDCCTLCPVGGALLNEQHRMVCHCLLIETEKSGLVLVDTGLGLADMARPRERLGGWFTTIVRPSCDPSHAAISQVQRLGFKPSDVRHIVVTHLDLDHAGGLSDFPDAAVHVFRSEQFAATSRPTFAERERYRPVHFEHRPRWSLLDLKGERWKGFETVRDLPGLPPEILLIPLHGHTRGHVGVAVNTGVRWLLHAGDAYFFHGEMDPTRPRCTPGLALFQRLVAVDDRLRRENQERLRELIRSHEDVRVFSAHDPTEFARY